MIRSETSFSRKFLISVVCDFNTLRAEEEGLSIGLRYWWVWGILKGSMVGERAEGGEDGGLGGVFISWLLVLLVKFDGFGLGVR